MTVFDLFFIAMLLTTIVILIVAVVSAIQGKRTRAMTILCWLSVGAAIYIGMVYVATALSDPIVRRVGDAQCSDDWCLAVDTVQETPMIATTRYEITLRIFSRARARAQRELIASDVYLVDSEWRHYDPVLVGSELPLDTLLQPGETVSTHRTFFLPAGAHDVGLKIAHRAILPICLIIGECEAFHKGPIIRIR
jgi:hypothetical protein